MKKKLVIKVISDLCLSSGIMSSGIINSNVIVDEFGFPYIPGKTIKAIFREKFREVFNSFLEQDNSNYYISLYDKLFGSNGFIVDDACIENNEVIKNELIKVEKKYRKYIVKSKITDLYTSTRSRLRQYNRGEKHNVGYTYQVINKGVVFVSKIELDNLEELEWVEKIAKLITHLGRFKNKGFGEVKLEIIDDDSEEEIVNYEFEDDLEYIIDLKLYAESKLMISRDDVNSSVHYIPGGNIMGAIASMYIKDNLVDFKNISEEYIDLFLNGEVKYYNSYITEEDRDIEYYPVPLSYAKIKDKEGIYYDRIFDIEDENLELASLSNNFVSLNKKKNIINVRLVNSIHNNNGKKYSFLAIDKNQYFLSHIKGRGKHLNKIFKYLNIGSVLRVGKSKSLEYGRVVIKDINIKHVVTDSKAIFKNFVMILTSPVILFDKNNVCVTTDLEYFINCLKEKIGEDIQVVKSFVGYSEEGGYNSIWNMPKRQLKSFEKGSIIYFKSDKEVKINRFFSIGLRQNEGYGQIKVKELSELENSKIKLTKRNFVDKIILYDNLSDVSKKVLVDLIKQEIDYEIKVSVAKRLDKLSEEISSIAWIANDILMIINDENNIDSFYQRFDNLFNHAEYTNFNFLRELRKEFSKSNIVQYVNNLYSYNLYKSLGYDIDKEYLMYEYIKNIFISLKEVGDKNRYGKYDRENVW